VTNESMNSLVGVALGIAMVARGRSRSATPNCSLTPNEAAIEAPSSPGSRESRGLGIALNRAVAVAVALFGAFTVATSVL
jgi:hypothetical protein